MTHRPVEDERARRNRPRRSFAYSLVMAALLVDMVAAVLVIVYAVAR